VGTTHSTRNLRYECDVPDWLASCAAVRLLVSLHTLLYCPIDVNNIICNQMPVYYMCVDTMMGVRV